MKAVIAQELFVETENKVGLLNEISKAISEAGVNIRTISAYSVENKAFFRIITSDNNKTKEVISSADTDSKDREVVILELEDKVGALTEASQKLKEGNIDLTYMYGTVSADGNVCMLVFSSNDNDKAIEVLS